MYRNGARNKIWIANAGLASVFLSVCSSVGIMAICGIKWNSLVALAPFLLLGVG